MTFFSIFPESVLMRPPPIKPLDPPVEGNFDLVILGYQVWFLSPSLPTTGFLRSAQADRLLKDTPIITLIACRDMWLTAQEKVKRELDRHRSRLIDNVVLVDEAGSAMSFLSTPLWMFTGRRGPWGPVPRAGVSPDEIRRCSRFGRRITEELASSHPRLDGPLLRGLGAVTVNEKTIASEKMAHRSFLIWSRLLAAVGPPDSLRRRLGLCVYVVFLVALILTVVPLSALIKKLLAPLTREKTARAKQYYAWPSGEGRELSDADGHER